jgi:ribosomal protein L11 methyltransferase
MDPASSLPLPARSWWRLEMDCPAELEESLLWKLPLLGIHRVALRHRPEDPRQRQLLAWVPRCDWPEAERAGLGRALAPLGEPFGLPVPPLRWQHQGDEDWSLSWKRHWQADPVGRRLLILPAWLELPADQAGRLVIRMDPGSAFGTGSHPTTRLCLEALEELAGERGGSLSGLRIADLGCGSGILSLASLALQASSVVACDTDPLAVRATRHNAALNGHGDREESGELSVGRGSVETLAELLEGRPADLLLCNILAPVIAALSPAFAGLLAASGTGLLSGLLVDQAPSLERALAAEGWQAELVARQEPWALMSLRRPGLLHKTR